MEQGKRFQSGCCWRRLSCCILLLLLVWDVTTVVSNPVNERFISFPKNLRTALNCACKEPHPRLIYIDDLEDFASPDVIYSPLALMVHRCERSTGYCLLPGQSCASVEEEEQEITFAVQNTSAPKKPLVMIPLKNHTRCECTSRSMNSRRAR